VSKGKTMYQYRRCHAAAALIAILLASPAALATAPVGAAEADPAAELARAHGFDRWDQIQAIRFTFSVRMGDRTTQRAWRWRPAENTVRMVVPPAGEGQAQRVVTYDRDALKGAPARVIKADRKFINDSFWLLLPLHLTWAADAVVRDTGDHALPLGDGRARRIVVQYPEQGGYTPGDRYELYVDEDAWMRQWTFHRGGAAAPTLATRWTRPARVGPLLLHLGRRNEASGFEMAFTDVAVRVEGASGWVEAEPLKAQADPAPDDAGEGEGGGGAGAGG